MPMAIRRAFHDLRSMKKGVRGRGVEKIKTQLSLAMNKVGSRQFSWVGALYRDS